MKTKKIISVLLAIIMTLGLSTVFVTAVEPPAYYNGITSIAKQSILDEIDGTVEESTWGEPAAIFTRNNDLFGDNKKPNWTHIDATGWNYRDADNKRVFENQKVELYVRRAENGIYLAVKLINAIERDQAVSGTSWVKRAGLDISIGTYDTTYNVKRDSSGNELFRTYRLMEDYNKTTGGYTTQVSYPAQNGTDQSGVKLNSYAIGFNDDTKTYTYELLIPYDETHILEYHDLVLSLAVRDAYVEKSNIANNNTTFSSSNVYNISDVCRATTKQGGTSEQKAHPFYNCNPVHIPIAAAAKIGDTYYGSVDQAVAAADNDTAETITLLKPDEAQNTVTVSVGDTLDLNGCVLTAKSVTAVTTTSFIKDSGNGQGGITISKDDLRFIVEGNNNNQLPLYDGNTYRFYNCEPIQKISTKQCKFGFQFTMKTDAYALLANSDIAGISLMNYMVLTKDGKEVIKLDFPYNKDRIREYAEKKNEGKTDSVISLIVIGFENVKDANVITLESVPTIVSSTGVKIAATSETYTHPYTKGE